MLLFKWPTSWTFDCCTVFLRKHPSLRELSHACRSVCRVTIRWTAVAPSFAERNLRAYWPTWPCSLGEERRTKHVVRVCQSIRLPYYTVSLFIIQNYWKCCQHTIHQRSPIVAVVVKKCFNTRACFQGQNSLQKKINQSIKQRFHVRQHEQSLYNTKFHVYNLHNKKCATESQQ